MKVLQLIDSLNAGGAERMAVNYANALVLQIETSYLCATREEGLLKESLSKDVQYLFLGKKSALDLKAIKRLNVFVKANRITVIHAHSTSFFLASLIKLFNKKTQVVWHDHNGNRVKFNINQNRILKYCSYFFDKIITVNNELKIWSEHNLKPKKVYYISNFSVLKEEKKTTILKGKLYIQNIISKN